MNHIQTSHSTPPSASDSDSDSTVVSNQSSSSSSSSSSIDLSYVQINQIIDERSIEGEEGEVIGKTIYRDKYKDEEVYIKAADTDTQCFLSAMREVKA
jgi:hypothetical protein